MKKLVPGILVILPLVSLALAIGSFHEAMQAKTNPDIYHFGSEAMIGEGGIHYSSQQAYIEHCQFWGALAIVAFVSLSGAGYFIFRKNRFH